MDESTKRPDVANPVRPEFAAAERYAGEWVIPAALGRAHLATRKGSTVRTACGATLIAWFSAQGRSWDGCGRCVAGAGDPR